MKICQSCGKQYQNVIAFCPNDGQKLVDHTSPDGSQDDPLIGIIIDKKYSIEHKIAEGGMSNIYLATHLQLDMSVAVKVMHERLLPDANAIKRFRREAQSAMKIRHTNAITVMDFGVTENNLVYLVMEYLQGMTLRDKLKKVPLLPLEDVNSIMQQVCAAVRVAHRHNIVHRDLKPDNIFLQKDGETEIVKVLDFGIAKLDSFGISTENLTQVGNVLGSPQYMSPEQFGEEKVDVRSDVYSLGVILFELLTGQLPFTAPSLAQLAYKHMSDRPPSILTLRPDLPASLDALVARLLLKTASLRPEDAGALAEELTDAFASVMTAPQRGGKPSSDDDEDTEPNTVTDGPSLLKMYARPEWPKVEIPTSLTNLECFYNIDALFLPEFFGTMSRDRVSGITWFSLGMVVKGVFWQDGEIVFAVSNDLSERMGERLVRQGRIPRRQLNEAMRWQYEHEGTSLIDALMALDFVTADMIQSMLNTHVYSICYSLIDWEEGGYAFEASDADLDTKASLNVGDLIFDSVRSLLDLGRIKAYLGGLEQRWQASQAWHDIDKVTLRPDESKLLRQLETAQTVNQLVERLELPEEQVLRTICALFSLGALKRVDTETQYDDLALDFEEIPDQPTIADEEAIPSPAEAIIEERSVQQIKSVDALAPASAPQSASATMESVSLFFYELENMLSQLSRAGSDYYAVLGISTQTSQEDVNAVYHQLMDKFNPDNHKEMVNQMPTVGFQLESICKQIDEAHKKLSDPEVRAKLVQEFRRSTGRHVAVNNNPAAPPQQKPATAPLAKPPAAPLAKPPVAPEQKPPAAPVQSAPKAPVQPAPKAPPPAPKAPAPPRPAAATAPPAQPSAPMDSENRLPSPTSPPQAIGDPSRMRNPDDWYLFGLELLDKGDADRAVRAFQNAVKRRPKDAEFHAGLARAYAQLYGDNDQTVHEFEKAIELQPKSADYPAELALYYLQHNHREAAEKWVTAALALDEKNRTALRAKKRLET